MSGAPIPPEPDDLTREAVDFLRTVDAGDSAMPASNGMRKVALTQIFSYWGKFGCPSLFLTLTPDDMRSMILRDYAGIDSLDPDLQAFINNRSVQENPVAVARWFQRLVDLFVTHVLGFDVHQHRPFAWAKGHGPCPWRARH